jgi:excinuclease UvrABC nuclease subunit
MIAQMHKLAEQQEFERAQEIKKRIRSLDLAYSKSNHLIAL